MGFTLADLVQVNRSVAAAFDEREQRPWGAETLVIELSKQVGDLARAVLTAEHYYLPDRENDPKYGGNGARIANELADILYCVMRLADHYDLDLWHDLRHHHASVLLSKGVSPALVAERLGHDLKTCCARTRA